MKLKTLFSIFAISLFCSVLHAQMPGKTDNNSIRPKVKDWIKKDVLYIVTESEKEAFLKLENDTDRETFIENFWLRRDPDPDTELNEFREEHYERIAFANENFTAGLPGWRTDRGRTYIVLGKPDKIEKGKATFENLENVPFEKWFYNYAIGFGNNIEIIFLDPTETGEFRFMKEKREKILELLTPKGLTISYQ